MRRTAGGAPERQVMQRLSRSVERSGSTCFNAMVPMDRPTTGYTARLIPHFSGMQAPLESAHILWRR